MLVAFQARLTFHGMSGMTIFVLSTRESDVKARLFR